MAEALRWIGFAAGVVMVLCTCGSLIDSLILPRRVSSRITFVLWRSVQVPFLAVAKRLRHYETQDRVLALLGPVSLLALLGGWLLLLFLGYGLVFWPFVGGTYGDALRLSGSSLLTLGFAAADGGEETTVACLAAATGLVAVALQIAYLPTIYASYNRRETLMTLLGSRAGEPAWGPELLARQQLVGDLATLPALFAEWEHWAADVTETHANYPWLMAFRSPHPTRSWIISLLAVLDAAALYNALAPGRAPLEARQCLRMGYLAMRTLAGASGIAVEDDPRPDAEIALTYDEFAEAVAFIRRAGFPVERTPEEAWPHFRGWRVNYEAAAYALADNWIVIPALWSGPRRHTAQSNVTPRRPVDRTPEAPEGRVTSRRRPISQRGDGVPAASDGADGAEVSSREPVARAR